MKTKIAVRASHVNRGSGFPVDNPPRLGDHAGQIRLPKIKPEVVGMETTPLGGVSLASQLLSSLNASQVLGKHLSLLKSPKRYRDSDHILAQVLNLFAGGSCLEDLARLQCSRPIRHLLGAGCLPDPTTNGDFLRRFDSAQLSAFDRACDDLQRGVWRRTRGRKRKLGIVDLDSHVHPVFGNKKEGADFSYKGCFGYHPLIASLSGTGEVLRAINRSGNVTSAAGAADCLREIFPLLGKRFRSVLVRGDSAFCQQAIFDACEAEGHFFAMVSPAHVNLEEVAENVPRARWKPFRAQRRSQECSRSPRRKRQNRRRRIARRRGKRDLRLNRQWVAEVPYRPARSKATFRLIIRRQKIEVASGQGVLFDEYRYRYVLTNLPKSCATAEVVNLTYRRCDQEKVIEQLKNGVSAFRMPLGQMHANSAFLKIGALAHNLKAWLAQIALPEECIRWEWKRFRYAFVYAAATVIRHARTVTLRFSNEDRFTERIVAALRIL